jgi:SagB-type dehydrogenase family enzyme
MDNRAIQAAWDYHQATKHSQISVQSSRHYLDWDNKPALFKNYGGGEIISLPEKLPVTSRPALQALMEAEGEQDEAIPGLSQLAYLLYYSAGITKRLVYPGGEIAFRAAACAGALYPIEIYLVCADLDSLPAGVYHFGPQQFELRRLRAGDFREAVGRACGNHPAVIAAPVLLVYSAITWRSAWKYQARSYRYHYWDCGTILANSLAASATLDLPARVVIGFVDAEVDRLLGLDGRWEKSLALLPVGRVAQRPPVSPPVEPLDLPVEPLSAEWREYPAIDALHRASSLADPAAVAAWRESRGARGQGSLGAGEQGGGGAGQQAGESLSGLEWVDRSERPGKTIEEVIIRRGSSRRFSQEAIPAAELGTVLSVSFTGFPADWLEAGTGFLNRLYLNVHAVDGLPPGAYQYLPEQQALSLLRAGNFRPQSAYLCLGQELGGTASATAFFLADLEAVLARFGNRGYRAAQIEAGILGGRLYLAAYAFGRGASGLTFFDDDVVAFFSPTAAGLEPMFVVALGVPAPRGAPSGRLVYTTGNKRT